MIKSLAKETWGIKMMYRSLSQFIIMESQGGTQFRNMETRTESETSEASSVFFLYIYRPQDNLPKGGDTH